MARAAFALLLLAACGALLVPSTTMAAGGTAKISATSACPPAKLRVAKACVSRSTARSRLARIVRRSMKELGLQATIVRVDTGRHPLASFALGRSMAGTPARRDMYFRIGSIAIPHLITVLLQLQDAGRLSLDDRLSRYRPDLPNADRITLRMLANNTSGYRDWIQGNEDFVETLYEDPFRHWTPAELLDIAFARGAACEPGTCFHYAHTNYAVLSEVITEVTGQPLARLISRHVFRPLGLRHTQISRFPAFPGPALHSYTAERGFYEDATYWSPSWTIGADTVMAATIGDVARTARAVGTGALISRAAARERIAPTTVGLPGMSRDRYYALGTAIANGWIVQNPMLNGYTGIMAHLPKRKLSVAIVTTTQRPSAGTGQPYASILFERLSAYLAPGHAVTLTG